MSVASLIELLEAGVHFGHQTQHWNPKMKPYIYGARNGIYILDLRKTTELLDAAYDAVREYAAKGRNVLFVGTKKQAAEVVAEEANRAGAYYINRRWLGGMLTNFETIRGRVNKLREMEEFIASGHIEKLPKKELIRVLRTPEGNIIIDESGKSNGRGAYLKKDIEVIKKARHSKILNRILEVEIPDNIYEELENMLK